MSDDKTVRVTTLVEFVTRCPVIATIRPDGSEAGESAEFGHAAHEAIRIYREQGTPFETTLASHPALQGVEALRKASKILRLVTEDLRPEARSEVAMRANWGDFTLTGHADVLDELPDYYLIRDFKRSFYTPTSVEQLVFYALLAFRSNEFEDPRKPSRVEFYPYSEDPPRPTRYHVSPILLAKYDAAMPFYLASYFAHQAGEVEAAPNWNNCGTCWWYGQCPSKITPERLGLPPEESDPEYIFSLYATAGKEMDRLEKERERYKTLLDARAPDGAKNFKWQGRQVTAPAENAMDYLPDDPAVLKKACKPSVEGLREAGYPHLINERPSRFPRAVKAK